MRGSPTRQCLIFLCLWAGLAWPISQITSQERLPETASVDADAPVATWISLRFSERPRALAITQNDAQLWQASDPGLLEFETRAPLHFDAYGTEFTLLAELPDRTSAIEVRIEADGHEARAQTLWVDGKVEETLSFTWGEQ